MFRFLITVAVIAAPLFFLYANESNDAFEEHAEPIDLSSVAICKAPSASIENPTLISYFSGLLSTENWPARWTCGDWSSVEGWMYISADLSIFLAYLSIPIILLWYIRNRDIGKGRKLVTLFAAFILLCGFTHLIDVVLFWEPVYRLSGFMKLLTGVVSLATATVLGFVIPKALEYKSPQELQAEIDERKKLQSQFETFVKYSPGATAMLDSKMRFLLANDGYHKAYGIEGVPIIGKTMLEVFPDLKGSEWLERFNQVLKGKHLSKELDSYESNGRMEYFRWKLEPWYDEGGNIGGFIIFTEILTNEVKQEEKLRESERRFTNIFNKAQFAIALVGDGGVPFLVNNQFIKLLGYTEDELTRMSFAEFTHPDDVKKDMDRYLALVENKIDSYTIDKRYITKSGEVKYVKLNVTMVDEGTDNKYAMALVEDLTEAEIAKIKNAEMDRMMAEVSAVANIGSWVVDVKEGKCYWSDTVYQIHEEDPAKEIALEEGINYYHPDHRDIISKAVEEGIANQKSWDLELKIITAKGNEKWTRAIGRALYENGEVTKLQGLFQDIDKKKRYELQIEQSNKGLEEEVIDHTTALEKANEALEAFSYSVSHDLRAPLRAINGYSEALIEDYSSKIPNDANQYLSRISANSQKMGKLIDDLLEFSRMNRKKVNYQSVNLNNLINRLIEDLFIDSKGIITIDELPEIDGDKEMLAQVFSNLISNAIKYSSNEEKPEICITFEEEATSYVISVQDNGVGFSMEYYDKLFKVFQRLHSESEFEGTGVGLSLCAKIMNAHDGEIWADSEKGGGATFYLKFKKQV
ncbi:PAS domain-containing sensor histidine kinase [Ekhidna sp.]|uniref:PAS domain-containing sensor histidine kinase n=1 Tax=Ekhidna sp. TaxID=2608089 RepID=UPI003C7B408D